jgi:hypothetical protein
MHHSREFLPFMSIPYLTKTNIMSQREFVLFTFMVHSHLSPWKFYLRHVSGFFAHGEHVWLVNMEGRVILEIPPGSFVLFPSALITHFNVDHKGIWLGYNLQAKPDEPLIRI